MGIKQKLEDAGVRIMAQTCLVISPLVGGYKKLITDSGKFASYLPSEHNIDIRYAETEKCVEAGDRMSKEDSERQRSCKGHSRGRGSGKQ